MDIIEVYYSGIEDDSGPALHIRKAFIELCEGDFMAAALLNQIVYWGRKMRKRGRWFYKSDSDWYDDICLNNKRVRRARAELLRLGLIETKLLRTNGVPTLWYHPCTTVISRSIRKLTEAEDGVIGPGEPEGEPIEGELEDESEKANDRLVKSGLEFLESSFAQTGAARAQTGESLTVDYTGESLTERAATPLPPEIRSKYAFVQDGTSSPADASEWVKPDLEQASLLSVLAGAGTLPGAGSRVSKRRQAADDPSLWALASTMAEVMGRDSKLASNVKPLLRLAKELHAAYPLSSTPDEVRARYGPGGWWYTRCKDWRALQGQKPNPTSLHETWGSWSDGPSSQSGRPPRQTYTRLEEIDIYQPPPQDKEGTDWWWDQRAAAQRGGTFDRRRDLTGGVYGLP